MRKTMLETVLFVSLETTPFYFLAQAAEEPASVYSPPPAKGVFSC